MRLTLAAVAAACLAATAAFAQEKVEIVYSDTVPEADVRSQLLKSEFGACLGPGFDFKPYHGATLFQQGTELTAMQRGNLDMANLAIFDFYNQVPETTIMGTAYLYRDYDHMRRAMDGDTFAGIWARIEEAAKVRVLANPYIGTRHLNLRGDRDIRTPADLAGVKLRMPGGEGWQFVGKALGANPLPMPFTEVYTGLQTGAIDAQDNPLPANRSMKFFEVTSQIVLTGHLIAANQFTIAKAKWESLTADQQATVQGCAKRFQDAMDRNTLKQEAELVQFFKDKGLRVYEPDRAAFRAHVLEQYLASPYAKQWPAGVLDKVNAL